MNQCIKGLLVKDSIITPVENGTAVIAGSAVIPEKWNYSIGFCLPGHTFKEIGP
ncbi:MAG: hypothetical protein Q8907_04995 [Bacteroidota bacterium]|nr:hypothetical protein [Bacteroidota bacterium]